METTKNAVAGESGQQPDGTMNALTRNIDACWTAIDGMPDDSPKLTPMLHRVAALHRVRTALMKEEMLERQYRGAHGPVWKGWRPWGYSDYVAQKLDLHKPYEQYGLYGSALYGLGCMARAFWRADLMMKAFRETDPEKAEDCRLLAQVTKDELEFGAKQANYIRWRGARMVVVAPVMWVGLMALNWRYGSNVPPPWGLGRSQ